MSKILIMLCMAAVLLVTATAGARPIRNADGTMPLVHWAVLHSKEGQMDAMIALAGKHVAPYAIKEQGTYALYGGVDKNNPNVMRLLEIYTDEAAYQQHRASEGFKKYQIEREPILDKLIIMEADPLVLEAKPAGEAKIVKMLLLEIKPQDLAAFTAALTAEMTAAVDSEAGVMGMFATAEKERPNVLHLLELYADEAANEAYLKSARFQRFAEHTAAMVQNKVLIENIPATVKLTGKPL